jgi:hypothetical protein
MSCEGTVVDVKIPEDGVNVHQNMQEQELICE